MLNIKSLFEMQHVLDQRIVKENNITHDRFRILVIALLDEIGECAKETRCFKDWSKKPASANHVILEEYVDGLHFVLSLGILCGYHDESQYTYITQIIEIQCKGVEKENDKMMLTQAFLDVYTDVIEFGNGGIDYLNLIAGYVFLGFKLGFSVREIESAYFYKNNVNHKRQDEGY